VQPKMRYCIADLDRCPEIESGEESEEDTYESDEDIYDPDST